MKSRVVTALILIPLVLGVLMSASFIPLACLAALLVGISYQELHRMGGGASWRPPIVPALVLIALVVQLLSGITWLFLLQLAGLTLFGVLAGGLWVTKKKALLLESSTLWLISPLLALLAIHQLYAPVGVHWVPGTPVLLALIPLWVGDTLAYLVGKRYGRHLLAPSISPKKTVEGGLANLLGSVLGGIGTAAAIHVPLLVGGLAGLAVGLLGQIGDLYESGLKRKAGLKDSGSVLPGHGGILDRIDSLLFSAPVVALLLVLLWPPHHR